MRVQELNLFRPSEAANLHERTARGDVELAYEPPAGSGRQLTRFGGWVGGRHQCLADEDGVRAPGTGTRRTGRVEDAAFGNKDTVRGDERPQVAHDVRIHREGAQVAAIHADDGRAARHRTP